MSHRYRMRRVISLIKRPAVRRTKASKQDGYQEAWIFFNGIGSTLKIRRWLLWIHQGKLLLGIV